MRRGNGAGKTVFVQGPGIPMERILQGIAARPVVAGGKRGPYFRHHEHLAPTISEEVWKTSDRNVSHWHPSLAFTPEQLAVVDFYGVDIVREPHDAPTDVGKTINAWYDANTQDLQVIFAIENSEEPAAQAIIADIKSGRIGGLSVQADYVRNKKNQWIGVKFVHFALCEVPFYGGCLGLSVKASKTGGVSQVAAPVSALKFVDAPPEFCPAAHAVPGANAPLGAGGSSAVPAAGSRFRSLFAPISRIDAAPASPGLDALGGGKASCAPVPAKVLPALANGKVVPAPGCNKVALSCADEKGAAPFKYDTPANTPNRGRDECKTTAACSMMIRGTAKIMDASAAQPPAAQPPAAQTHATAESGDAGATSSLTETQAMRELKAAQAVIGEMNAALQASSAQLNQIRAANERLVADRIAKQVEQMDPDIKAEIFNGSPALLEQFEGLLQDPTKTELSDHLTVACSRIARTRGEERDSLKKQLEEMAAEKARLEAQLSQSETHADSLLGMQTTLRPATLQLNASRATAGAGGQPAPFRDAQAGLPRGQGFRALFGPPADRTDRPDLKRDRMAETTRPEADRGEPADEVDTAHRLESPLKRAAAEAAPLSVAASRAPPRSGVRSAVQSILDRAFADTMTSFS